MMALFVQNCRARAEVTYSDFLVAYTMVDYEAFSSGKRFRVFISRLFGNLT